MRRHIQLWGTRSLAVVLLVIGVQRWGMPLYKQYFTPKEKKVYVPTVAVKEGPLVISFHEIGAMKAEKSVFAVTEVGGKIITLITDGKVVKKGDQIALLDTTETQREMRNQQLNYQNALADVRRAKAEFDILKESNKTEVEQAEAQLNFDQTELERAKKQLEKKQRLAADKLVPQSEVEQAELDVRSKELSVTKGAKALALKKKEVESKEQQKQADVRNVEFKSNMTKFNMEDVQRQLKNATLAAPASGLVVLTKDWTGDGRRALQEGDQVRPRQQVCELPDLSKMQVKVKVGESDAPKVKPKMATLIKLEAVPNRVFHGTVKEVASVASEALPWEAGSTPGKKTFEVTIDVKEVDPKTLKPGLTGDVEFISETIKKTVYLPIEAVTEKGGKTYAFIQQGKKYVRTEVKVGKSNDNFVAITKGLKKGQKVALRDPTRPAEEQESDKPSQDEEKKDEKAAAPIPGAAKK